MGIAGPPELVLQLCAMSVSVHTALESGTLREQYHTLEQQILHMVTDQMLWVHAPGYRSNHKVDDLCMHEF